MKKALLITISILFFPIAVILLTFLFFVGLSRIGKSPIYECGWCGAILPPGKLCENEHCKIKRTWKEAQDEIEQKTQATNQQ